MLVPKNTAYLYFTFFFSFGASHVTITSALSIFTDRFDTVGNSVPENKTQ